jgi:hypothetical protein
VIPRRAFYPGTSFRSNPLCSNASGVLPKSFLSSRSHFLFQEADSENFHRIYDKLHDWSDDYPWSANPREVCLWVSLYYFSRAGPDASSYIYYEALHDDKVTIGSVQEYIDAPLGLADFPVEISNSPKAWRKTMGKVVFEKTYDKGGHFAGWERPGDLADGLCEMFGKGGGAYGVVGGRDGY